VLKGARVEKRTKLPQNANEHFKVYIQLLQPLAVNLTDSGLALAIKELKSSVEPTTGLNQAIIWKALIANARPESVRLTASGCRS
jgi:hypothetical protein